MSIGLVLRPANTKSVPLDSYPPNHHIWYTHCFIPGVSLNEVFASSLQLVWYASVVYLSWRTTVAIFRIRWARFAYPNVTTVRPPSIAKSEWMDRCQGCLIGFAIGDSVNLPAESVPRWLAKIRYPSGPQMRRGYIRFLRRPGDISDDTQLMIAVARSINPTGVYSHERFIEELGRWSYFRIGAGKASLRAALRARRLPTPSADLPVPGSIASPSEGNGAAIRVAPFAIQAKNHAELINVVRKNAQATHNTEAAKNGAVFIALLMYECLRLPPNLFANQSNFQSLLGRIELKSGFSLSHLHKEEVDGDVPTGHVHACIPAVARILLTQGNNFRAAMTAVFRAGGDTDSIGAMVAACIGAQVGFRALPNEWATVVQHRDYLIWLSERLSVPSSAIAAPSSSSAEVVEVVGAIVDRDVELIVNAWNRNAIPRWLLLPQGVTKAIALAGGSCALRSIGKSGPMPLGTCLETRAGSLEFSWIVHTVAINLFWNSSESSIRQATRSSLLLAQWLGARTVALPLLGSGTGGVSKKRSLAIMLETVEPLRTNFDRIEIVHFHQTGLH